MIKLYMSEGIGVARLPNYSLTYRSQPKAQQRKSTTTPTPIAEAVDGRVIVLRGGIFGNQIVPLVA